MRGDRMYQRANYYLRTYSRRFGDGRDCMVGQVQSGLRRWYRRPKTRYLACLLLVTLSTHSILAQQKSPEQLIAIKPDIVALPHALPQTQAPSPKRSISISDAVSIF